MFAASNKQIKEGNYFSSIRINSKSKDNDHSINVFFTPFPISSAGI